MILIMFESDFEYLPTVREIRDGLIEAQMQQLQTKIKFWHNKMRFQHLKTIYLKNWSILFSLADFGNIDQPLSKKILSNPEHRITQQLLYIYSMESFIYTDMNRAIRNKDKSQIHIYGAFAAALSYIIIYANQNKRAKEILPARNTLYRGLKVTQEQLKTYIVGRNVNLTGYTSTTKDKNVALMFALKDCKPGDTDQIKDE